MEVKLRNKMSHWRHFFLVFPFLLLIFWLVLQKLVLFLQISFWISWIFRRFCHQYCFWWDCNLLLGKVSRWLMGIDIETGRSTNSKYWTAHVGWAAKSKQTDLKNRRQTYLTPAGPWDFFSWNFRKWPFSRLFLFGRCQLFDNPNPHQGNQTCYEVFQKSTILFIFALNFAIAKEFNQKFQVVPWQRKKILMWSEQSGSFASSIILLIILVWFNNCCWSWIWIHLPT